MKFEINDKLLKKGGMDEINSNKKIIDIYMHLKSNSYK